MDPKLLGTLNLNESELVLYQAILLSGSIPPSSLAKAAGLKRTTAYSVARSLVEKGLVVEDATRRPRVFTAASPEQVLSLIDKEKRQLAAREDSLQKIAGELSKLSAQNTYPVPTVRFIEEEKLGAFLRQRAPIWDANMLETEPRWWGFQDHTLVEHYGDWISWYWKQAPEQIDLQLLSNRAPVEVEFAKNVTERRNIKFWGEATNFQTTHWAIGDYVIMINTRARPFYLVEIHDRRMAHDQREVFRNLWDLV